MRRASLFLLGVLIFGLMAQAQTVQTTTQVVAATETAKHGENVLDACFYVGQITLITIVVSFAVAFMMKLMAKLLHRQSTQG